MPTTARACCLLLGFALAGCASPPAQPKFPQGSETPARLLLTNPDWTRLDVWRGAVTETEWRSALDERYAPHDAAQNFIGITPGSLNVLKEQADPNDFYHLPNRAPDAPRPALPLRARYWRTRAELGPAAPGQPLAGLRVALDPGHLGGAFAEIEARSFSVDGRPPVREGDMTLRVAQILKPRLEALGANVTLVRDRSGSVTSAGNNPARMAQVLASFGALPNGGNLSAADQRRLDALFYRDLEIRARADIVNERLHPDLVLCLHFDAVDWPDPQKPALVQAQHFHILVNGAYSAAELANDAARFDLVQRVASGAGTEELAAARAMAEAAVPIFGLPAFKYTGPNAVALGGGGYVWGRNLLANRLYDCPVVYFEPYVLNSVEGYERAQAGEYSGTRVFNGVARKNIYEEYADAVVAGLVKYYGARAK